MTIIDETQRSGNNGSNNRGPSDLPPVRVDAGKCRQQVYERRQRKKYRQGPDVSGGRSRWRSVRLTHGPARLAHGERQDGKNDEWRDTHEAGQPFRRRHDFPHVPGGREAECDQPQQNSRGRSPLPADEKRGKQSADKAQDLDIGATTKRPVHEHGAVAFSQRHRLENGQVGVWLVGQVNGGPEEVHCVPQVRSRRAVEPPDLDGGRKNQRNQKTAYCREYPPRIRRTVPDGQQQPGSEQDDLVSLGSSGSKESTGNPRHPFRTCSRSKSDGESARRERDRRRVLHAAYGIEPQRPCQTDGTYHCQPISRRRHDA